MSEIVQLSIFSFLSACLFFVLLLLASLLGEDWRIRQTNECFQNRRRSVSRGLVLKVGMATHPGRVRSRNEDKIGAVICDSQGRWTFVILP